jgi:hypothetical protein
MDAVDLGTDDATVTHEGRAGHAVGPEAHVHPFSHGWCVPGHGSIEQRSRAI